MKHSLKLILTTNPGINRDILTSPLARRLAVLAIAVLLIGMALSARSTPVARAATTITVTAGPDVSAAVNDWRRIQDAINAAANGDTIMLSGTFDFTQPFAAAAWALGNDNTNGTADDYSVYVPAGVNNVTITASSLGAATIQGPGDLAAVNLEGVFVFDGGPNQGWTISNIQFKDFDLSIAFFATPSNAFNNTKIINNYIKIAQDLNATVAPADVNQNIGIHFSFGTNQMISGNTIEFDGDGVSDSANGNFSTQVGMQSNTSGGNVYDGLQITNNILRVLKAQSADPEVILGIWENAHAHTSNITVSGNQFINLAAGNNPATNLQRAFRVTSHSSATTTVKYQNNSVGGANIGFQWLAGSNFSGNQPVQLISNNILNNGTGVLIQSNGSATLSFNRIVGNTIALDNETGNPINAQNNWWGCNYGPGVGGAGCAGTANGVICTNNNSAIKGGENAPNGFQCLVDFDPWLVLRLTAVPNTIFVGGTSTLTADLTFNSDNVDTHLSGNIPDGTPVAFAGNAFGTVSPSNTSTTSGKATSTYTGTAPGTGNVSTTVDMQTVTTSITVNPSPCVITCPPNQVQPNDPNQCGAVVTYPAPTPTGTCGTITCSPASGSFFPVGTTTVTCTTTAGPSCSFTITVNDTQPPSITCPANITKPNDPNQCGAVVTYPPPTITDNCPGTFTATCAPASGSFFPTGTTTVTCSVDGFGGGSPGAPTACSTITESSSQAIVNNNSVSCNNGVGHTDNSYWRAFALPSFGISGPWNVQSVDIGIELASAGGKAPSVGGPSISKNAPAKIAAPHGGGSQPITVRLWTSSMPFPTGYPGSLTMIGSVNTTIPDQADTVINIPVTGTAPAGSQLVVEVFTPDGEAAGNLFFIGSNAAAETGPSYLSAAACGITNPTTTAALGFPDMHIVMNVNGCTPVTGGGPTCSFTVTVNDTQPPTITCPANINVAAAATCPPTSSQTVTFAATASDNCPGVTVVCSPASGSIFPVGTTSVTCTAMDTSGNTASCTFSVTVFSACLVDQTNSGNVVLFNTQTGDYRFCCSGVLLATGKGVLTIRGCIGTIDDQKGTRKVHIGFDFSANSGHGAGTAALFLGGSTNPKCTITDQSMAGNVCTCPTGGPPVAPQK